MASSSKVADLRAELTLNASKFEKGIDKSKSKLKGLGAAFNGLKGSLAGILSVGVLAKLTNDALKFADAIGKSADRIGITTTSLQELRFAFDRAGVSQEDLDKGLLTFAKRLGKARQDIGALVGGLKGGQEALLGSLKATNSNTEALDLVFNAMGRATNQSERLAIADAAFGTVGLKMTEAFLNGNKVFDESIKLARSLGIVMEESLIRNAEATNDKMSALAQILKIKVFSALVALAPQIGEITEKLIVLVGVLSDYFGGDYGTTLHQSFENVQKDIQKTQKLMASFGAKDNFAVKLDALLFGVNVVEEAEQRLESLNLILDGIKKAKEQDITPQTASLTIESPKVDENFIKVGEAAEGAEKSVEGFFSTASTIPGQTAKISEGQALLNRIWESSKTPLDALNADLDELNARIRDGEFNVKGMQQAYSGLSGFTVPEVAGAVKILQDKIQEIKDNTKDTGLELQGFFTGIGQATENALVSMITGAETLLGGLKATAKSILEDIIRMVVRNNLIEPLFGTGGSKGKGGLVQEGLGALGDLVKSSFFGGFATGGQFTVGGQGGIDNNLVAFNASRGERVTIETPGQQKSGGGVTVVQNLNFSTGIQSTVRAEIMNMLPTINKSAKQAVFDAKQRGGAFAGAFG